MECPHCKYEDAMQGNHVGVQQGELGDFLEGQSMSRANPQYPTMREHAKSYGCPRCGFVFVGPVFY